MTVLVWVVPVWAVLGALCGLAAPLALGRLPEPAEPDPGKVAYAELARRPRLGWWLAAASGGYAALAALMIGDHRLLPVWLVLAAVGPLLAYVDWQTHLLPYLVVAPAWVCAWIATGISAVWARDPGIAVRALVGNILVFAAFWVLYVIAGRFFGGGFGYGDVRLSAVLGVALGPLGPGATFWGVYVGFLLGALVGLARQRGRLRVPGAPPIAFGPFMVLGALVALAL